MNAIDDLPRHHAITVEEYARMGVFDPPHSDWKRQGDGRGTRRR